MSDGVSIRDRHSSYGVLSTVLALLIAIVYASESYDDWDSVVALIGSVFAGSFLWRVTDADVLERLLASFLASLSFAILVVALSSLFTDGRSTLSVWIDARLLWVATTVAAVLFALSFVIDKARQ